jgi:KTSC domain
MPSSVVSTMTYNPATSTLRIRFVSGSVYDYKNVPHKVYREMQAAESKGTFLNKYIKKDYAFKKIR